VFNAANEVAALAFLDRRLSFLNIAAVIADTLSRVTASGVDSGSNSACDAALAVDSEARGIAESIVRGIAAAA
jgi:1-deoxy-D-xylulose-5-phosphate reductoisomerase